MEGIERSQLFLALKSHIRLGGVGMDSYSLSALGQNSLSCMEFGVGGVGVIMKDGVFRENMFSGETRSSGVILTSALEGKYVKGEMVKLELERSFFLPRGKGKCQSRGVGER